MGTTIKYVSIDEYIEACNNWHKLYGPSANFSKFIGNTSESGFTLKVKLSESGYNKIQLLKSPHYRTLMKAFIARTGYHKRFK